MIYLTLELSGIWYVVLTFIKLRIHKKTLEDNFSHKDRLELNWLKLIIWGMVILWTCIILIRNEQLIFLTGSFFAILIGFFGIRQSGVFSQLIFQPANGLQLNGYENAINHQKKYLKNLGKDKYAKSGLQEEVAREIHRNLLSIMTIEKPFLNPELNLSELSDLTTTPPNHLSQVINEIEKVNFYDFINWWRIEEFKILSLKSDYSNFTLTAIAYECGLNSKATFNRAFKKITGESPTQFLKNQKASHSEEK